MNRIKKVLNNKGIMRIWLTGKLNKNGRAYNGQRRVITKQKSWQYLHLTESETKRMVIEKKWFATLALRLDNEMQRVSQSLNSRLIDLEKRYEQTLPEINDEVIRWKRKCNSIWQLWDLIQSNYNAL